MCQDQLHNHIIRVGTSEMKCSDLSRLIFVIKSELMQKAKNADGLSSMLEKTLLRHIDRNDVKKWDHYKLVESEKHYNAKP